jgi:hypothetical protein
LKNWNRLSDQAMRRIIPAACATALAVAFSLPAHAAGKVTPPDVPPELKVDEGNHPFLVGHAFGTQNYVCAPSANGVACPSRRRPRFQRHMINSSPTLQPQPRAEPA